MYIDLVQKGGAEVILVPSAFTVPTGSAHWHVLLRGKFDKNVTVFGLAFLFLIGAFLYIL